MNMETLSDRDKNTFKTFKIRFHTVIIVTQLDFRFTFEFGFRFSRVESLQGRSISSFPEQQLVSVPAGLIDISIQF